MRLRVFILLALMVGVIGLMFLAARKSDRSTPATATITNSPSATAAAFRRTARASSLAAADLAEHAPVPTSNVFQRIASGELDLHLDSEQLAEYLRQYGTNVETLLATQNKEYIKRAAELFPNDPRVQYAVVTRDIFPEAKREWLDRLKQSAPDNAIANYLSAREYLKAGNREQGLKDLADAAGKSRFDDYTREQVQNMEDAQLSAGRSLAEAKFAAGSGLLLPQFAMFKGVAIELQTMQKEYIGAGDASSAEALAQMGRSLGQQLSHGEGSHTILGQLVGIAAERIVLNSLPPDSQPPFLNGTVQQRIDEMTAFRQNVKTLMPEVSAMVARGNENEIISYFDRMKLQGEYKALLWLQNRNKLR
ncbi:MAG TPA: hypothetical protein VK530_19690 [Candidatus Acidoferrum sp.]|nr:hypothetical protein [Candidatus Acidoferrum sp.]